MIGRTTERFRAGGAYLFIYTYISICMHTNTYLNTDTRAFLTAWARKAVVIGRTTERFCAGGARLSRPARWDSPTKKTAAQELDITLTDSERRVGL